MPSQNALNNTVTDNDFSVVGDVSANNLLLPLTTSTVGQIKFNNVIIVHIFGNATDINLFVGKDAGNTTLTPGTAKFNTAVGGGAMTPLTTGHDNSALGVSSLTHLTSGDYNTACGVNCLSELDTGDYNQAYGYNAGMAYDAGESSNICIGNNGVNGESNKLRIGTQGAGNAQQNNCFIAGIYNVTPGGTTELVIVDSNGELGSEPRVGGGVIAWTEVTGAAQAAALNNGYITNRGAGVTVTLPDTAPVGSVLRIIGKLGNWVLAQNAGETIHFGNQDTTPGVGGSLTATDDSDCVELICTTANTNWTVMSSIGNLAVV